MNQKFLNRAVSLAYLLNDKDKEGMRCQHFTFIFFRGKIIAIGQNQNKSHPINLKNTNIRVTDNHRICNKIICSELDALNKVKRLTNIAYHKCELVNIRIDRNQKLTFSHPCKFCISLLDFIKPKSLFYTDKDGNFVKYE